MNESWYVINLTEQTFSGPFALSQMKEAVKKRQIESTDLVFCTQKTYTWGRAYEIPAFELEPPVQGIPPFPPTTCLRYYRNLADEQKQFASMPLRNSRSWFELIPERSEKAGADWFILKGESERGPFLMNELEEFLKPAETLDWVYVWRADMERWKSVAILPQFRSRVSEQTCSLVSDLKEGGDFELGRNLRSNQRQFVTAHVVRIQESSRRDIVGICVNISLGGFQIILDRIGFECVEKSIYSFEIRPIKASGLLPFKVEASLRWVEDHKRMGFKIQEISEIDRVLFNLYLSKGHF